MDKTATGSKLYHFFVISNNKIADVIIIALFVVVAAGAYTDYILQNSITLLASPIIFGFCTFAFLRKYS